MAISKKNTTVEAYIRSFPGPVQTKLRQLRKTILTAAPEATEAISYGIAGYKLNGVLIFFAGFKNHVSIYPAPRTAPGFKKELSAYKGGKGTVQFPLEQPLPLDLVKRIVQYRVKENKAGMTVQKKAPPSKKKTAATAEADLVGAWINKQDKKRKEDISVLREVILGSSRKLQERIKWNAPSYYYKEDIVTVGPSRNQRLLLVFHHPAINQVQSPLLEGNFRDRKLAWFDDGAAVARNKKEIKRIINQIIAVIDKKQPS